jgi:serine phosphatase RsbU (regulator of sigma subunit)
MRGLGPPASLPDASPDSDNLLLGSERPQPLPATWRFQTNEIADLVIEVLWRPADDERSGDFVDLLDMPNSKLIVVLGDVAGHGQQAELIADDLRYLLRRALHRATPTVRALAELDRYTAQVGDGEVLASMLVVEIDLRSHQVLVLNAGHPSPLLTDVRARGGIMQAKPDPPIGISAVRRQLAYSMQPRSSMLLFTDGLLERGETNGTGSVAAVPERAVDGLQLIRDFAADIPDPIGTRALADRLVEELGQPTDDATLISIRRVSDTPTLLTGTGLSGT